MRLRKIKLSGFKSFVDPTTLTIPGDRVGIVGPNGCGKSNIIDAMMWVMGESSAKHLRGDALTDVIFNGSNARKPVGQAMVELVFDNSDGRVTGQYASYNEISIKRQIDREGQSQYFLNGGRCRRRDITAIFLGTGLGPRSYSIIEQGMISRFIEAKPDELRLYIEEAAGISKYRERRRETENRISHTKENISRLNDIRDELEKQLEKLQRQAKAAERYQELKKEERKLSGELLALDWRQLKTRADEHVGKQGEAENAVEAARARLRQVEAAMEQQRSDVAEATEDFNTAQSEFYQVGADIAQLEQKLEHTRERVATLERDVEQIDTDTASARSQLEQDQQRLQELVAEQERLNPQLEGSRNDSEQAYEYLNEAEQAMQGWQSEWDAFNEQVAQTARAEENARTRLEHLELSVEEAEHRREQLQREQQSLEPEESRQARAEIEQALKQAEQQQTEQGEQLEQHRQAISELRSHIETQSKTIDEQRAAQQDQRGRLASLEALQQAALGQDQQALNDWVTTNGYDQAPRLAQALEVDADWTLALETVLGPHLQDLVLDDIDSFARELQSAPAGELGAYANAAAAATPANPQIALAPLADKVHAPGSLAGLLAGVYVADDMDAALVARPQLAAHESIITRTGVQVGPDWLRSSPAAAEEGGTLDRERELNELRQTLADSEQHIESLLAERQTLREQLAEREQALEDARGEQQRLQETVSAKRSELAAAEARAEQQAARAQQIEDELQGLAEQIEADRKERDETQTRADKLKQEHDELLGQREELAAKRERHREALDKAREQWQTTNQESHGIALRLESLSSQRASLEQGLQRVERQLEQQRARREELSRTLEETRGPLPDMQEQLTARLEDKQAAEQRLKAAREKLQGLDETLRGLEQQRSDNEQQLEAAQKKQEDARMAAQETRVRLETVEEQLRNAEHDLDTLLAELSDEANQDSWREQLAAIQRKIDRLGPINLAAIDEHQQLSERKDYLDSQYNDLAEALETLENAIRKIDKETRTRFKETFDQLNDNLASLFPELFGGGHAYLEMTGDDLLETGVAIMARPPGKRNSNIHMLSGGEKALTAVALVFSIFKLNPAPFCILDEVDAPLDDTNVGRFSEMVRKMSEEIQFIVITHNKITMEIASQLIGVTMQEAGVSRLVTVDMDEAVAMAAAG
ncbi:chromosome segregation protein [Methylohalomonas lacus]|uniref:Chromosome partition protein Smc n=1 Tax=Methylohalomonas lacus TaxID=398773 RepID=A0AAE3HIY6_9GAMM|nr:chromosome segregation protein SMC [Methylohalomonas lacus]MCS3902705.1 chromosome segregation protein [Methylohalomonas lacus]